MEKYYVFIKEYNFKNRIYFEAITCVIDFDNGVFRRITDLIEFLSSGDGLSEKEEEYKSESFRVINNNTRSLSFSN